MFEKMIRGKELEWAWKAAVVAFVDVLVIMCSYLMALFVRFDFVYSRIPQLYIHEYLRSIPYWVIATLVVFYI